MRIQISIKSTTCIEYKSLNYGKLDGIILDQILLLMDPLLEVIPHSLYDSSIIYYVDFNRNLKCLCNSIVRLLSMEQMFNDATTFIRCGMHIEDLITFKKHTKLSTMIGNHLWKRGKFPNFKILAYFVFLFVNKLVIMFLTKLFCGSISYIAQEFEWYSSKCFD
jgi:hypothetical protein